MIRTRPSFDAYPGAVAAAKSSTGRLAALSSTGRLAALIVAAVLAGGVLGHLAGRPRTDGPAAASGEGQAAHFEVRLAREVERLASVRESGRRQLAEAGRARQQAAGAAALAGVHVRIAERLKPLAPPRNAKARRVVAALSGVAAGYARLGAAAGASDDAAFAREAKRVKTAEAALQTRLSAFAGA